MMDFKFDCSFADKVALACQKKFLNLGKSGKPNSIKEWTYLAGIVMCCNSKDIEVVALGTGTKCVGFSQMSSSGDCVHDSHAEVIARRAFILYLMNEVMICCEGSESVFIKEHNKFVLKPHITFHLYTSHVPCGDACIFPKPNDDSYSVGNALFGDVKVDCKKRKLDGNYIYKDIYRTGGKCLSGENQDHLLPGVNYHVIGSLRNKPGRGEPTHSLSCSDKIFKWNVLGIQGGLLVSILKEPLYLCSVIIGKCPFDYGAMKRAIYSRFETRFRSVSLPAKYRLNLPFLLQSAVPFVYCKNTERTVAVNTAIVWSLTPHHIDSHEVLVNGRRLGTSRKNVTSPKSQVSICRKKIAAVFISLLLNVIDVVQDMVKHKSEYLVKKLLKVSEELKITKSLPIEQFCNSGILLYKELKELSIDYVDAKTLMKSVLKNWPEKPKELKKFFVL